MHKLHSFLLASKLPLLPCSVFLSVLGGGGGGGGVMCACVSEVWQIKQRK